MPVPTTIDQLSTTAASNFPAGSDNPSSLDDVQRVHASFIATIRDTVGLGTGTLVPATARTNFGATGIADLAAPDGSSLAGYLPQGTGAVATNVQAKLRAISYSVKDAGCVEGEADSTTKYQAAIDYAIANGLTLDISGNYNVTSINLNGANGLRLTGRGSIVGIATGATDALLSVKNVVNVAVDGAWFINGNYNTNYVNGVWVYTDAPGQQAAYIEITNVAPVSCKRAWKFGNDARPDDLVSEINVTGGHSYGCPSVVFATGVQTVVNFTGCTLASLTGAGDAAWQALPQQTVVARGATVNITGGELLHVLRSTGGATSSYNTLCQVETLAGAGGNQYGSINVTGTIVETGTRLASSANVLALASPASGLVKFVGCHGVSTQDIEPFIETDADYVGRLIFKGNNFFSTTARGQKTFYCNGLAHVYCDDESFGTNFQPYIEGSTGGIVHHPYMMVLDANNLNGQSITTGVLVPLVFTVPIITGHLARYAAAFSGGVFTVPAGGLKNIRIASQLLKAGLLGEWYVQINGTAYGVRTLGDYNENSYSISNLAAGDTIRIATVNTAPTVAAGSTTGDWFQIFASV